MLCFYFKNALPLPVFKTFLNRSLMIYQRDFYRLPVGGVPAVNISGRRPLPGRSRCCGPEETGFRLGISLDRNVLNITVENQTENSDESKRYNKREFSYSSFVRSFTLPDQADHNRIGESAL